MPATSTVPLTSGRSASIQYAWMAFAPARTAYGGAGYVTLQRSSARYSPVAVATRSAATRLALGTVVPTGATAPTAHRIEEVIPSAMSDEEAQDAVLQFVQSHTGADACDIADALNLPIRRAFTIVDALIEAGKLEVDGG